jgi:protein-S-isoprenylcysteine O-methyltransferase Ste14
LSVIFGVAGLWFIVPSARSFIKAKTNLKPWKSTSSIVTSGFYRYSRNPMYMGMLFIGTSASFGLNSLWVLCFQFVFVGIIQTFVIANEERYLENKFGEEYLDYKLKVRRWL